MGWQRAGHWGSTTYTSFTVMITKLNVHHNVIVVCMEKHYNNIDIIYVVLMEGLRRHD